MKDNGYLRITGDKLKCGDVIYGYKNESGSMTYVNGYIVKKVMINWLSPIRSIVYVSFTIDDITGHPWTKLQAGYYLQQ